MVYIDFEDVNTTVLLAQIISLSFILWIFHISSFLFSAYI